MLSKRFYGAALMAALTLPTVLAGCGDDPLGSLCCTDFKVGADLSGVDFGVDASIKGQFSAFAQASSDLSGAASAALDGVTGACKAIAQVGGANASPDNEPTDPGKRVEFWCNLATAKIDASFQAQGGVSAALQIAVKPAECKASFSAEANCQASCSVDASCDVKAKPPTCEGGKLEVSCEGSCEAEAGASIACEGSCTGKCDGACTA
ncbi:MAG: keratin associated protein, partial [Labilithrix sp.]|nr:keratin associated protein [Labilithrix sp.]